MKAIVVTIGDEILIGQITDTNSGLIAAALDKIGVETVEMISISDKKQHILDTFTNLQNKVDFVIITGGLGPTKDDITKHTICEYFDDVLVRNQDIEDHVVALFEKTLKIKASQVNKDQALMPSSAQVLHNAVGTAAGMWLQKGSTVFVSMPGVPYEMKSIVTNELIPKIAKEYKRPFIIHKTILTYGQGESMIAERIELWENSLPDFIKLAYLPSPGRVRLRLSARGLDQQLLQKAIDQQVVLLTELIGDIIVGFDDSETIEVMIGRLLVKHNFTFATAESCTGGKIAQRTTTIAGSSQFFKGSIVAYDTQVKKDVLGLTPELIQKHGVVSSQVAVAMAESARHLLKSSFAIATTGEAGPIQSEKSIELGTVFIAIASKKGTVVESFCFGQPREKVIDRAVNKAFEMLQKEISKNV